MQVQPTQQRAGPWCSGDGGAAMEALLGKRMQRARRWTAPGGEAHVGDGDDDVGCAELARVQQLLHAHAVERLIPAGVRQSGDA